MMRDEMNLRDPENPTPSLEEINADDELTPEEAWAYLGVDERKFKDLVERYGVARRNVPRESDQFIYLRSELEKIRHAEGIKPA
jgi:hypothetical protein